MTVSARCARHGVPGALAVLTPRGAEALLVERCDAEARLGSNAPPIAMGAQPILPDNVVAAIAAPIRRVLLVLSTMRHAHGSRKASTERHLADGTVRLGG
jgi:hypothetical protein